MKPRRELWGQNIAVLLCNNLVVKDKSFVFSALFDAVEHQDMERAQQLLESNGLDVNW